MTSSPGEPLSAPSPASLHRQMIFISTFNPNCQLLAVCLFSSWEGSLKLRDVVPVNLTGPQGPGCQPYEWNLSCRPSFSPPRSGLRRQNITLTTVKVLGLWDMWIIRVQLSPPLLVITKHKPGLPFNFIQWRNWQQQYLFSLGEFCWILILIPAVIWLLYRVGLTDCNHYKVQGHKEGGNDIYRQITFHWE